MACWALRNSHPISRYISTQSELGASGGSIAGGVGSEKKRLGGAPRVKGQEPPEKVRRGRKADHIGTEAPSSQTGSYS